MQLRKKNLLKIQNCFKFIASCSVFTISVLEESTNFNKILKYLYYKLKLLTYMTQYNIKQRILNKRVSQTVNNLFYVRSYSI